MEFIKRKFTKTAQKNNVCLDKTYTGKVILLQASETYGYKDDLHMGWSKIFNGEVKKFIIEGDHLEMMVSPVAAKQIAEILNRELLEQNS